jgi:hypothetical protein
VKIYRVEPVGPKWSDFGAQLYAKYVELAYCDACLQKFQRDGYGQFKIEKIYNHKNIIYD